MALHGQCNDSEHRKQKKNGSSFVCCWQHSGTPVTFADGLDVPEKNAFKSFRAFSYVWSDCCLGSL